MVSASEETRENNRTSAWGKFAIPVYTKYIVFARWVHRFIKPRPITIRRNGKSFTIFGNLEYLLFLSKYYEPNTHKIFDRFLDPNYSYIDIGAFIGSTVLYGACLAKKVYAIEPDPIAFKELQKNVLLNPMLQGKIDIHQKCLYIRSEKVKFGSISKGGDSMSSLLFGNSKTSWFVDGITFDEFIKENTITDCNFIKMDIEGGEVLVLPSMEAYLEKEKPTLYLSMHPHFFKDPKNDTKKIIDVLRIYKNIYTDDGKKIELNNLLSEKRLEKRYAILATDTEY
jgi:FkbM family methyltransferase